MRRPLYIFRSIIEWSLRVFGLDVLIDRDPAPHLGFAKTVHARGCREYWCLGLHITVSRLRTPRGDSVHPQVA